MKYLSSILVLLVSLNAHAYMLDDNYVGGDDNGHGDVIGYNSKFNTHGLDVSVSGSWLTVDIYTNFADDIGVYPGLTYNGKGIGVGDLFLSNSWSAAGSAGDGYLADDASTGTVWSYGLAVDDAYSKTGGSASLYALNGATNDDNVLLSDDFLKSGTYRNGQEVAVDTASQTTSLFNSTGTWTVFANHISFNFDIAGTGLLDDGMLAIHWAMLCGNDVIQGEVPVSVDEPATLALFGFGLLGLVAARRRTK